MKNFVFSHVAESFNFACNDNAVDECSKATVENRIPDSGDGTPSLRR